MSCLWTEITSASWARKRKKGTTWCSANWRTEIPCTCNRQAVDRSNGDRLLVMIDLPCGLQLSNHLVKPAMEESLASYSRPLPNEALFRLYRAWAAADYGLLITGNVQVDSAYRGTPYDVCHVDEHDVSWRRWAESTRPVPCLVQLCHTGRQSPRGNGRYPWQPSLAPSAVPLRGGSTLASRFLTKLLFGTPRALTSTDMDKIVDQFARAARTMERAGFAGVQLHCRYGETPWAQQSCSSL